MSEADREEALALDGAAPFDPMGNGAMRSDKVQMPESIMDDATGLAQWVRRSFEYAATLPSKKQKAAKPKPANQKPTAKRPAANKPTKRR